jgi:hypothetical protein
MSKPTKKLPQTLLKKMTRTKMRRNLQTLPKKEQIKLTIKNVVSILANSDLKAWLMLGKKLIT